MHDSLLIIIIMIINKSLALWYQRKKLVFTFSNSFLGFLLIPVRRNHMLIFVTLFF